MWPLNATPQIRERQIALQSRVGVPSYLKKPGSKLYVGAFGALLGAGLIGNMFYLVQYARGKANFKKLE
ncbi:hypothetical protein CcaverHIS002_0404080 [Cutaneotrichosporon cavernicola]|uniref:Uncharacterized protein n=1 Tax=Cutaneotrichosporon cavernicola TaxID=279322 RepID=A0AA48L445_9TREE|nr:uncharacterized protein CcaverHIS019_0404030 [Cutaneotrichosporon cavernicola]BEI83804.1 hypothetical protein CcaverHIS002_0404080 [Cutaneotrichosporon cavernicola]BEI91583.1 hypothetical protein CcaverHIS019_0404030 [Cutaneotrichosporon cavernicola]BEI99360.1 hypothetical protein CcaverHIS631_0404030 [Cutaneotrichosporon cavernicola]BEJ07135.1 hypothetical protein CcaverHIS641_0404040 [Cutaneotrichosporon cavernicola]